MSSVTRVRAPHRVHVLSWALALERDGSVACHFKDCHFMALSLEEMGNHYSYSMCENSKYPFVCEECDRRTDGVEKLILHKLYSHSYKPTVEESRKITDYQNLPVKKKISPLLKRSWEIFLEKKKYLKCLSRQCCYVTDSIENMEEHYLNFCKEVYWSQLKCQCEYCYGRVTNDSDLQLHIKTAHESKTYLVTNNIVPSNLNCVEIWSNEILLYKQGKCFIDGCRFVDNNVKILQKHYASCKGKNKNFVVCCVCGSWLQNETRLNEHRRCFHKDLDDNDFRNASLNIENDSQNCRSLLLDNMSPGENDALCDAKDIKTEDSHGSPLVVKIPILYLQPDNSSLSAEDIDMEDPLAMHPSTTKDKLHLSVFEPSLMNGPSERISEINSQDSFLPKQLKFKSYRKRVNILRKKF